MFRQAHVGVESMKSDWYKDDKFGKIEVHAFFGGIYHSIFRGSYGTIQHMPWQGRLRKLQVKSHGPRLRAMLQKQKLPGLPNAQCPLYKHV